ncbi:uncharacterized protein [Ptychodera flava]|uniref:uncharacterized protein n=1 Tax=Ptychodera flava TaxID=63121 RepID=UPI00396A389B
MIPMSCCSQLPRRYNAFLGFKEHKHKKHLEALDDEIDDEIDDIRQTFENFLINDPWVDSEMLPINFTFKLSEMRIEPVGSNTEGFSLTESSGSSEGEEYDINLMYHQLSVLEMKDDMCVSDKGGDEECVVELQFCKDHPGYVLLTVSQQASLQKLLGVSVIMLGAFQDTTLVYLSPKLVVGDLYRMIEHKITLQNWVLYVGAQMYEKDPEGNYLFQVGSEGPAVHLTALADNGNHFIYDMAIAFPCQKWPSLATPWLSRFRMSGWPSVQLVNEVVKIGCAVVPKSPENSKTSLEWRLSFSLAERRLAKDVTIMQKSIYIMVKLIYKKYLKHPSEKGVQSYHLKNIFLWMLEEIPCSEWTNCLLPQRVTDLLQRLNWCLTLKYCPHYFIPENNLFQGLSNGEILFTQQQLVRVIMKPKMWYQNPEIVNLEAWSTRLHTTTKLRVTSWQARWKVYAASSTSDEAGRIRYTPEVALVRFGKFVSDFIEENLGDDASDLRRHTIALVKKCILQYVFPNDVEDYQAFLMDNLSPMDKLVALAKNRTSFLAVLVAACRSLTIIFHVFNDLRAMEMEKEHEKHLISTFDVHIPKLSNRGDVTLSNFGNQYPQEHSDDEGNVDHIIQSEYKVDDMDYYASAEILPKSGDTLDESTDSSQGSKVSPQGAVQNSKVNVTLHRNEQVLNIQALAPEHALPVKINGSQEQGKDENYEDDLTLQICEMSRVYCDLDTRSSTSPSSLQNADSTDGSQSTSNPAERGRNDGGNTVAMEATSQTSTQEEGSTTPDTQQSHESCMNHPPDDAVDPDARTLLQDDDNDSSSSTDKSDSPSDTAATADKTDGASDGIGSELAARFLANTALITSIDDEELSDDSEDLNAVSLIELLSLLQELDETEVNKESDSYQVDHAFYKHIQNAFLDNFLGSS